MVNSRPTHDDLRAGCCQKQPAYCSPAPDLVTRLPRRSGASTFLGISVSAFSFRKPPQQLNLSPTQRCFQQQLSNDLLSLPAVAGERFRSLDVTPALFSPGSSPTATGLSPTRRVVGARDAEHIGKVYEGFCRQRTPATASL